MNSVLLHDNESAAICARFRTALVREAAASNAPWYAVADGAQDAALHAAAARAGLPEASLYAGRLGVMLSDVAPHLVAFSWADEFPAAFLRCWSSHVGVLIQTRVGFDALRKHLRHFLMVKDEGGKRYRFRFYDPRILRAFLPACTEAELAQLFGPIERFYTPTRDGDGILAFGLDPRRLTVRQLAAGPPVSNR